MIMTTLQDILDTSRGQRVDLRMHGGNRWIPIVWPHFPDPSAGEGMDDDEYHARVHRYLSAVTWPWVQLGDVPQLLDAELTGCDEDDPDAIIRVASQAFTWTLCPWISEETDGDSDQWVAQGLRWLEYGDRSLLDWSPADLTASAGKVSWCPAGGQRHTGKVRAQIRWRHVPHGATVCHWVAIEIAPDASPWSYDLCQPSGAWAQVGGVWLSPGVRPKVEGCETIGVNRLHQLGSKCQLKARWYNKATLQSWYAVTLLP